MTLQRTSFALGENEIDLNIFVKVHWTIALAK